MQRLNTRASRGEEIGLKAGSQPGGICAGCCALRGDAGAVDPNSCCLAVGPNMERRSPLSERFTTVVGPLESKPAPVVGNDGIETSAAVNSASERIPVTPAKTPAKRTEGIANIGLSPKGLSPKLRHQLPPCSETRATPPGPRAIRNVSSHRPVPCCSKSHRVVIGTHPRAGTRRLEQTTRSLVDVRTGHPFPPPPVLGRPSWAQSMDRSAAP